MYANLYFKSTLLFKSWLHGLDLKGGQRSSPVPSRTGTSGQTCRTRPRWKEGTPFDFTKMYSGGECPGGSKGFFGSVVGWILGVPVCPPKKNMEMLIYVDGERHDSDGILVDFLDFHDEIRFDTLPRIDRRLCVDYIIKPHELETPKST